MTILTIFLFAIEVLFTVNMLVTQTWKVPIYDFDDKELFITVTTTHLDHNRTCAAVDVFRWKTLIYERYVHSAQAAQGDEFPTIDQLSNILILRVVDFKRSCICRRVNGNMEPLSHMKQQLNRKVSVGLSYLLQNYV